MKLLTCPFCGRQPHTQTKNEWGDKTIYIVYCATCDISKRGYTQEEAETAWNTRYEDPRRIRLKIIRPVQRLEPSKLDIDYEE